MIQINIQHITDALRWRFSDAIYANITNYLIPKLRSSRTIQIHGDNIISSLTKKLRDYSKCKRSASINIKTELVSWIVSGAI